MGWLGDSSHRGQGCQAWTAAGLLPRYPHKGQGQKIKGQIQDLAVEAKAKDITGGFEAKATALVDSNSD